MAVTEQIQFNLGALTRFPSTFPLLPFKWDGSSKTFIIVEKASMSEKILQLNILAGLLFALSTIFCQFYYDDQPQNLNVKALEIFVAQTLCCLSYITWKILREYPLLTKTISELAKLERELRQQNKTRTLKLSKLESLFIVWFTKLLRHTAKLTPLTFGMASIYRKELPINLFRFLTVTKGLGMLIGIANVGVWYFLVVPGFFFWL